MFKSQTGMKKIPVTHQIKVWHKIIVTFLPLILQQIEPQNNKKKEGGGGGVEDT